MSDFTGAAARSGALRREALRREIEAKKAREDKTKGKK